MNILLVDLRYVVMIDIPVRAVPEIWHDCSSPAIAAVGGAQQFLGLYPTPELY